MEHPISAADLRKFLNGTASPGEYRTIVAHLIQRCRSCSEKLRALALAEEPEAGYDASLNRIEQAVAASLSVPIAVEWHPWSPQFRARLRASSRAGPGSPAR